MNQSVLKRCLIAGTTLLLAVSGTRADPFVFGSHRLMVKTPFGSQRLSIYVSGTAGNSSLTATPQTTCYGNLNPTPRWHYISFIALNGSPLQVITFTSPDCTTGYNTNRVLTVPLNDGLKNLWIDASY